MQVSELLLQFLNGASNWMIQLSAFAGGVAAVAASYLISRKSAHSQTLSLVLTGTMIMSLCNAGVTMIKYVADPNDVLQQITFWLMGSLTKTTTKSFSWSVLPMIIGLSLIFIFRWQINLLTLDEEEAKSLGINVRKYRLIFYSRFHITQRRCSLSWRIDRMGRADDPPSGTCTGWC